MDKTVSDFIRDTFLGSYAEIVKNHPYVAFYLIFGGIELLGKCLDENVEFDDYKRKYPEKHFKKGLSLFDPKYQKLDLYHFCRNGFAHCVRPIKGAKIGLSERKNITGDDINNVHNLDEVKELNTAINNTKRVLFIEDFYQDFVVACNKVLQRIQNGELTHTKLTSAFLPVRNYELVVP